METKEIEMTPEQKKSLELLKQRWDRVEAPTPEFGGYGAILVWVHGGNGAKMLIGIEKDGYTHS